MPPQTSFGILADTVTTVPGRGNALNSDVRVDEGTAQNPPVNQPIPSDRYVRLEIPTLPPSITAMRGRIGSPAVVLGSILALPGEDRTVAASAGTLARTWIRRCLVDQGHRRPVAG